MRREIFVGVLTFAGLFATSSAGTAATLDDVMARLDSLQRDNQAMRKEIAALRQKEQRQVGAQAGATRNAPSLPSAPAASSAMAADFPAKGYYVEPAQAFSWSGFYLGLHAGYGWGSNNWSNRSVFEIGPTVFGTPLSPETNGVLGGIQAGANFQFNNWVLGIEADFAVMRADGRSNGGTVDLGVGGIVPGITNTGRSKIDWLTTFTGRWGYAFDRSLFFVKGGVAAARYVDEYSVTTSPPQPLFFGDHGTKESTRVGWVVGGGWEYAFATNWSAKVEYNYLDFGTVTENFTGPVALAILSFPQEIEHKLHIVKAGLNYRF